MTQVKFTMLRLARHFGYDVQRYGPHQDPINRLQHAIKRHNITTVLDVGANVGQFGQLLRMTGYTGKIISFEPLSDAYAKLVAVAQADPQWTVAPRCAVAASSGETDIQIAGNSQSSSILEMLDRHVAGNPKSAYIGKERVSTITLDDFLSQPRNDQSPLALKIDTQGYEAHVLAGLNTSASRIKVIQAELSLTPLYDGAPKFSELYRMFEERGYHCISMEPNFIDPQTYEVLQVDAIFSV